METSASGGSVVRSSRPPVYSYPHIAKPAANATAVAPTAANVFAYLLRKPGDAG